MGACETSGSRRSGVDTPVGAPRSTLDPAWAGGDLAPFGVRLPVDGAPVELSYSILDAAPVGMALIDNAGGVWWVNSALCRLLGRPRSEILGRGVSGLVHSDDWDGHRAMVAGELDPLNAPAPIGQRWVRSDGSHVWVEVSASVATDAGGRALTLGPDARTAVVIQAVDISGQRTAEEEAARARRELEARNLELERSNQELAEFAYVVSHDLSEPLRVIAGHLQLLNERYRGHLDAQADEWIGYAVDGAARLRSLIDSLLAYSRAGRFEHPATVVDTAAVVHAAVAGLRVAIDAAAAVVVVGELPAITADASEVGRVFANLIGNSLKFRRQGVTSVVRVAARRGEGEWRFVVVDNGIGIPERHRERVFRLFQRLHRREEYEGTGMGLAICRKIVERGGGRIWIEDAPEGGTAVWFTVPDRGGVS